MHKSYSTPFGAVPQYLGAMFLVHCHMFLHCGKPGQIQMSILLLVDAPGCCARPMHPDHAARLEACQQFFQGGTFFRLGQGVARQDVDQLAKDLGRARNDVFLKKIV